MPSGGRVQKCSERGEVVTGFIIIASAVFLAGLFIAYKPRVVVYTKKDEPLRFHEDKVMNVTGDPSTTIVFNNAKIKEESEVFTKTVERLSAGGQE